MHLLSCLVPISPIVCSSYTVLADEEVLGVVDILIRASLDAIDDLGPPSTAETRRELLGYILAVLDRS